jgi:hypothetical protein
MSSKVYCKDCKYYNIVQNRVRTCPPKYTFVDKCCQPIMENYSGVKVYNIFNPKEKNKNNDCKNYKRKWWKFWIVQNLIL